MARIFARTHGPPLFFKGGIAGVERSVTHHQPAHICVKGYVPKRNIFAVKLKRPDWKDCQYECF
ncbi:MAG: hypothetical protein B6245_04825 [Desulfobacteraceae bacterium 4572_88]|nr:MAG: hypothetical protein B6245_04825 [Desulfobacteraceae bacterium 4572_88]RLC21732.1 MAG: hypothetical protein DRI57_01630 [Deltaproteobacteria bacterium]